MIGPHYTETGKGWNCWYLEEHGQGKFVRFLTESGWWSGSPKFFDSYEEAERIAKLFLDDSWRVPVAGVEIRARWETQRQQFDI